MEETRLVVFTFFVSVCFVVFLISIFHFWKTLQYFIDKIFFRGSLPIQKYLPDENFRKCLPT